jgi:hypothetical protein
MYSFSEATIKKFNLKYIELWKVMYEI